jgi:hypothetical protein
MVLCADVKRANIYKKAGVPKDRVFTPSTVKDRAKGKMVVPPHYMIVDEIDSVVGALTGQPVGAMSVYQEGD